MNVYLFFYPANMKLRELLLCIGFSWEMCMIITAGLII